MNRLESFLKTAREQGGMTQLQLSRKLGLTSPQFVSNWERGVARVPIRTLAKLVKLFKLEIELVIDLRTRDSRDYLTQFLNRRLK